MTKLKIKNGFAQYRLTPQTNFTGWWFVRLNFIVLFSLLLSADGIFFVQEMVIYLLQLTLFCQVTNRNRASSVL